MLMNKWKTFNQFNLNLQRETMAFITIFSTISLIVNEISVWRSIYILLPVMIGSGISWFVEGSFPFKYLWVCFDNALDSIRYLSGKSPLFTCCLNLDYLLFIGLCRLLFHRDLPRESDLSLYIQEVTLSVIAGKCFCQDSQTLFSSQRKQPLPTS